MTTETQILPNEVELFGRLAHGDETAFEIIFHHYNQYLYPFLITKTKSRELAEEIVQEVFLKLWDRRSMLSEVENYRSYIFRMAVNLAYNYFKRASIHERVSNELWDHMVKMQVAEETIDYRETSLLINKAVEQLPAGQKRIYLLSRQEGLNHEEIAAKLNISKRTVSNQITSALSFIKEYLERHPGTPVVIVMIMLKWFRE